MADPSHVIENIKERTHFSMFGDVFEPNAILTDVIYGAPFFPSRLGRLNETNPILCECTYPGRL